MDLTAEELAVLAKVCAKLGGHQFDLSELITPGADGTTVDVGAHDPDAVPHLFCRRCNRVWLVVVEGGTYEAAEETLDAQTVPERRRPPRAQRKAQRLAREEADRTAVLAAAAAAHPVEPSVPRRQAPSAARPGGA